jgi:hypothetical protein
MSAAISQTDLQRLADLGLLLGEARSLLQPDHPALELLSTLGAALLDASNAPSSANETPQLPEQAPA